MPDSPAPASPAPTATPEMKRDFPRDARYCANRWYTGASLDGPCSFAPCSCLPPASDAPAPNCQPTLNSVETDSSADAPAPPREKRNPFCDIPSCDCQNGPLVERCGECKAALPHHTLTCSRNVRKPEAYAATVVVLPAPASPKPDPRCVECRGTGLMERAGIDVPCGCLTNWGRPSASPAQEATPPREDAAQYAEHCRSVAIAAVREFAKELGQVYEPSFTRETDRFADYLRSRDYAAEFRAAPTPEATAGLPCAKCGLPESAEAHHVFHHGTAHVYRPEATGAPEPERVEKVKVAACELYSAMSMIETATLDAILDRLNRRTEKLAAALATVAALAADREAAHRVHLRRHTRLAEALGMDPGYSVDATIDAAIKAIVESRALTAERNRWHGKWKAAHEGAETIEAGLRADRDQARRNLALIEERYEFWKGIACDMMEYVGFPPDGMAVDLLPAIAGLFDRLTAERGARAQNTAGGSTGKSGPAVPNQPQEPEPKGESPACAAVMPRTTPPGCFVCTEPLGHADWHRCAMGTDGAAMWSDEP